jgi:hypothetical protein
VSLLRIDLREKAWITNDRSIEKRGGLVSALARKQCQVNGPPNKSLEKGAGEKKGIRREEDRRPRLSGQRLTTSDQMAIRWLD